MILIADNIGRPQNSGYFGLRTVFQRVGSKDKFGIYQFHLMVEHRQFGCRTVLSPFGSKDIFLVGQRTAVKVIS